jgi:CubicO group peptidase (beta-lactamase class C family)
MKKNRAARVAIWTGIALAFLGLLGLVFRPAAAKSIDTAAIDAIVQKAQKAWQVPGAAVAIVRGDEVVYLKGFGVKRRGSSEPVTPDTLFPIASCTKAFTTTAMAMLADEGRMDWDDPVRRHVPYFHLADPLADADVRLRDLVTHRTGLGGNDLLWYRSPWDRQEIIRRIGRVKLKHPFRTTFQYQSTMFAVAGCAVESASGCRWKEFVQKRIFDPLGIKGATFTTTGAEQSPDHASPHRRNGNGEVEVIPWYPMPKPDPAGSINAGARDLANWVRFQLGDGSFQAKRLVSAKNLNETHTPQMVIRMEGPAKAMNPETVQMSYGMAWVIQDYRGHRQLSHAGAIDGFRAHLTLVPDAGLGLVILNNLHGTAMNLAVSNNLVDLLLDLPRRDWDAYLAEQVAREEAAAAARLREREAQRLPGTKPSRELEAYTGQYENTAYGTATLTLENGGLVWKWGNFTAGLGHFHFDTFTLENDLLGRPLVQFTLGTDGEVAAMKVTGVMDVEFKKVRPKPGE